MLPKLCIAFMFFTIVCFSPMAELPFARQALITMGRSSGVRPTATERENRNEVSQSPLVMPETTNTTGTKATIKRIKTQAIEFAPVSKLCLFRWSSER